MAAGDLVASEDSEVSSTGERVGLLVAAGDLEVCCAASVPVPEDVGDFVPCTGCLVGLAVTAGDLEGTCTGCLVGLLVTAGDLEVACTGGRVGGLVTSRTTKGMVPFTCGTVLLPVVLEYVRRYLSLALAPDKAASQTNADNLAMATGASEDLLGNVSK